MPVLANAENNYRCATPVMAGRFHSFVVKNDGTLWAFGYNSSGQLGDGTTIDRYSPVQIKQFSKPKYISAGWGYSLIVDSNNTLWGCGYNSDGRLGTTNQEVTTPIKIMENVLSANAGFHTTFIIKEDHTLWACGSNENGEFGVGNKTNSSVPRKVLDDVAAVSSYRHTLVVLTDGSLMVCGNNENGQLGDGTKTSRTTFKKIMEGVADVKAAAYKSLILMKDGRLLACGKISDSNIRTTPYQVATNVSSISGFAGDAFVKADGSIYEGIETPKKMTDNVAYASNYLHTLAVKKDASLWVWGKNQWGQLGDGTTTDLTEPKKIMDNVALPGENGIEINATNFPDAGFRNFLLGEDYGSDGVLTESEIKSVTYLTIYNIPMNNLKGIEYFTALEGLWCSNCQLTSLDVSKNTELKYLFCDYNQLTSIDVSKNTKLDNFYCSHNKLTSLDLSKNPALGDFACYGNQLTALDVSKNPELVGIFCDDNRLTTLDLSNNPNLTELSCSNNKLTALDVSKNPELRSIDCYGNKIQGENMDALISGLNSSSYRNELVVIDISENTTEENVCTKAQVAAAKAKGWTPMARNGKERLEYEGSEEFSWQNVDDTDITSLSNTLYIANTEGFAGSDLTLSVRMKNTVQAEGFNFDLLLPEGVSVVTDSDGFPDVQLSEERTSSRKTNTFEAKVMTGGVLRVFAASTNGSTISGNDGEVCTVKIHVADEMKAGDYPIVLKEISIADKNAVSHDVDYVKSTLTVNDYILGDANRDGKINVSDYVAIVHHYMGNTPASFNEKAADVNRDGKVNVADYTAVVHLYLNGSVSGARRKVNTDISQKDNTIYIDPVEVVPGEKVVLSVKMKNAVAIEGFNFDLYLPSGFSFVLDGDGFPEAYLSTERTTVRKTNTFESVIQADGSLRVFAASTNGSTISGNDGEVAQVTIQVPNSIAAGSYPLILRQISLADTQANSLDTDEVESSILVKDVTGIEEVCTNASGNGLPIYSLSGQRLAAPKKGINIVGGRKVVVR